MNFPLVTWQVAAPAFTISNTISILTFGGVDAYGYGYSGTGQPPADTLARIIWDAMDWAGCTYLWVAYDVSNTTSPNLSPATIGVEYESPNPLTITFSSLEDAAVYGFTTLVVTAAATSGNPLAFGGTYNAAGLWAPSGVSGDVTRTTKQRAAASSSDMSGLSTDVVNWGEVADIEMKSTLFPAANTFYWYATQAIYAQKAQRNVNDPNNILEKMLAAAATGVTFRIYEGEATTAGFTNADYLVARMPGVVDKNTAASVVQPDDEPRLWTTTGLFFRGTT
jgi:hypothetical protein